MALLSSSSRDRIDVSEAMWSRVTPPVTIDEHPNQSPPACWLHLDGLEVETLGGNHWSERTLNAFGNC